MAGIGKGDAEKILKKYGYKVQEHLGEGKDVWSSEE